MLDRFREITQTEIGVGSEKALVDNQDFYDIRRINVYLRHYIILHDR